MLSNDMALLYPHTEMANSSRDLRFRLSANLSSWSIPSCGGLGAFVPLSVEPRFVTEPHSTHKGVSGGE